MTKQKVLNDGKLFTIYLEKEHIAHIKRLAARMSIEEGRDISASEAARLALTEVYPFRQAEQLSFIKKPDRRRLKKKPSEHQKDSQASMFD
jgi:hypothetical protein